MKILLLNPNTRADITQLMMQVAQRAAGADTTLIACTAPRGVPYIATRAEAQIGGAMALEMLADMQRYLRCRHDRRLRRSRPVRGARTVRHSGDRHGRSCDADRVHGRETLRHRHLRAGARSLVRGMRARCTGSGSAAPASACSTGHSSRSPRCRTEKEDLLVELALRAVGGGRGRRPDLRGRAACPDWPSVSPTGSRCPWSIRSSPP